MRASVAHALLRAPARGRGIRGIVTRSLPTCPTTARRQLPIESASKWQSRSQCSPIVVSTRPYTSTSNPSSIFPLGHPPKFAFAFDIDGVLLHVAKPIPRAGETLQFLHDNNIPFILLTNGGGKHESERVADLIEKLGVPLTTDNFVQSHTPFQQLAAEGKKLRNGTILVTGSDASKCREIAERYGFKNVVIPADILQAQPEIWPFDPLMEQVYKDAARPLPRPVWDGKMNIQDALKIDAIFVFNDPRDWALDSQIIMDLMMADDGVLGSLSHKNGKPTKEGWQHHEQPGLYFSNPDVFWATTYHQPRLGQGAFQAALAGIWSKITGGDVLRSKTIGKPFQETYEYAERMLNDHRREVLVRGGHAKDELPDLCHVYMVGDNPASDIRGANEFQSPRGTIWQSVLVRTGVWRPPPGETTGPVEFEPKIIVDDVKAAVQWAMEQEGFGGHL